MADKHTEETTLTQLHEKMCKSMGSTELLDYLMDSMEFLKTIDLTGWERRFMPVDTVPTPKVKRQRRSPNAACLIPMDRCVECGSDDVLDDITQGQWVCVSCGLIQQLGVCTGDIAHCSYDMIMNRYRVVIHRYSRIVHFKAVIFQSTGDTNPVIEKETLSLLRADIDGKDLNVEQMFVTLRRTTMSRRYRKHAHQLVAMLGGPKPKSIPSDIVRKMLVMFLAIEYHFKIKRHLICPNRKVFFSYKFLMYQILHELDATRYTGPHHLLKSRVLLDVQRKMYEKICVFTGFKLYA